MIEERCKVFIGTWNFPSDDQLTEQECHNDNEIQAYDLENVYCLINLSL